MYRIQPLLRGYLALATAAGCAGHSRAADLPLPSLPAPDPLYEYAARPTPDGTGKIYCGREIAQVMGHQGLDWLERPERESEEHPHELVSLLQIKPGETIADIGAGSGYYTRRLAGAVGSAGRVYAVDVQPEMLDELNRRLVAEGITNVVTVKGSITDPRLAEHSIDTILLVDVYHEFSHPFEMVRALCRALKPGGRLVIVEFRSQDPRVPIKPLHTMTESQVRREMARHPLRWIGTFDTLPWQQMFIFTLQEP